MSDSEQALDAEADVMAVTAERDRLRARTHELQEAHDKEKAKLEKRVKHWFELLGRVDEALTEPGVMCQSAVVRAAVAKLMDERDKALARAQAAEAGICQPGCETLVAVETERNAAEARARAYRKCLVDLVANADVNYKPCGCCISPMPALLFEAARQVLLHPEAQSGRVAKLEAGEGYLGARGVAPLAPGSPKPEEVIRRLRDPEAQGERVQNLEALASAARKVLAVCDVPVMMAMPQSSIELLQELREALDATGKEAKGDD